VGTERVRGDDEPKKVKGEVHPRLFRITKGAKGTKHKERREAKPQGPICKKKL